MRNLSILLGKIFLFVLGFFFVFNIYFILLNFTFPTLHRLWDVPYIILTGAFSTLWWNVKILSSFLSIPHETFHAHLAEIGPILRPFVLNSGKILLSFAIVLASAVVFERFMNKSALAVAVFYSVVLPAIWLILFATGLLII